MPTYRVEATVSSDGTVTIKDLPFRKGDRIEVVMRSHERCGDLPYPLRGRSIRYDDPFGSVAEDDWEVLQ